MRYFPLFTALVLGCSVLALSAMAAEVTVMDEIICKVNGDIITRTELERDRKGVEASLKAQGLTGARLTEAVQAAQANLLRDRIDQLLMIQKAKELNLNVDSDVNKEVADIQRGVTKEHPELADPQKFQDMVREQTGQPFEDWKGDMKNKYLTQKVVREEVGRRVNVKKEELRQYYDEHKTEFERKERIFLRQIVISTNAKDTPEALAAAEKKAKDLVAQARKGARFPDLAQNNSDDAATARMGGAVDPVEKDQLNETIVALVWNQERGYVTDPIKTPTGWMILKVDDHQKAGLAPFEDVESEISNRIYETRMDPGVRAYLTRLRQEAFLEIKPGFEDTAAAPNKTTAWTDPAELKPETITKEEVVAKGRHKKLLWTIPLPGTKTEKTGTSSSR